MEQGLKQKQIEEMARILCPCSKSSCDSCIQNGVECIDYREARAFYNAGYRKIAEGSVVLTREEHQKYLAFKLIEPQVRGCLDREEKLEKQVRELDKELNLAKSVLSYDDERPLEKWAEHLRKETAENFAEMIKVKARPTYVNIDDNPRKDSFILLSDIDKICKEFTEDNK